jgi:ligand-binding sensor domain-containing protein/two-component sensor histidine kinase
MIYRWIFLLFCSISVLSSNAQSYSFLSYSIAEGLPQSQVSSIAEDEKGYLWVGTLGGLGKFNGSSFVNYSTKDGLLNNRITSLNCFDQKLWIGHEGGVSLLQNGKIKKWTFPEKNKNVNVLAIKKFQNGFVIATNGGGIYYVNEKQQIRNIELKSEDQNRVRGLLVINQELFIATRGGLLKTNDLYNFSSIKGADTLNISGITQNDKEIVLTTFDTGIFKFNLVKKSILPVGEIPVQSGIRNCILDSKGNIWIPSKQGIIIIDKNEKSRLIDQFKGLPLDAISNIFEDRNGTIWIGSEGKGLFRFPGEQFVYFNSKSGIQSELITAGIEIYPNHFLFGTYDKGLIQYRKNENFILKELPNNTIWAIETDINSSIWMGSEAGLFKYQLNGKVEIFDENAGAPGEKITSFYKEKNGEIWIGGSNGISKISNGKLSKIKRSETNKDIGTIRNIVKYKKQLFCAADGGLFIFKNGKYHRFKKIRKKTFSLKIDQFENLWIGTDEGFFWSDGNDLKQIMLSDQPASNFINFINTNENQVFVGTNNGLYVLSDLKLKYNIRQKHYGLEEGLVNLESNINSSFVDRKGRLWFGTAQGLTAFDPDAEIFDFENILPNLNIKSIKLNFQSFNYADYSNRFNKDGIPLNLILPRSKNNLLIELDGVTLKNSKDLRYQYWLEGLDEGWSPEFSNPQVTLSNLPSGNYNLHVRVKNGTGEFSKEYILFIKITPAFYATWWFFLLVFIFLVGLIMLIIQLRVRRERARSYQESLEYKARLSSLEQQSLNASMNRHFIFNSLNSIQYFINTQDKISANRYLTNFAKLIRKNLDSSSEDNNMVSLSQEIERLELYLSLESMRFRDRFEYKIEVSDIDTENIMVPAMLFQPFVENSIIHGILPVENRKGLITINIEAKEDHLVVVLEDNGIGIDFSLNKKRQTEGDHRSQGMEITSKRIELLKKLSHRNFEMEGPFQIEDENHSINGTRVLLKIPCENLD